MLVTLSSRVALDVSCEPSLRGSGLAYDWSLASRVAVRLRSEEPKNDGEVWVLRLIFDASVARRRDRKINWDR